MKSIGDYIDQNPISSIFAITYFLLFVWIAIEWYNAPNIEDDEQPNL